MRSSLAEASSGGVHVFRKWMSERVVQQGCVPLGNVCFAVLNRCTTGTPRVQGQELHKDRLIILRGGEEFTIQRPKGMDLLAVTFEAAALGRLLDARIWSAQTRRLLSRPVLQAPSRMLQRFRRDLLSILESSRTVASAGASIGDLAAAQLVFETLSDALGAVSGTTNAVANASATFLVAECHRIVARSGKSPPRIDALCQRLRSSRRSLQNSFQQVAHTTPVHYLRSLRLNVVRTRLRSTPQAMLTISQAAAEQGFTHLSHFTARYKTLFGELPSQTVRGPFERPC